VLERSIFPSIRPNGPAVEFERLTVAYGDHVAVEDVTAALRPEAVVGLLGPNGAGKTTLLRALVGVLPPARGAVRIHGASPREAWHHTSYLPQHEQVNWDFPVSALDVVLMGRVRALGWLTSPRAEDRRQAAYALERVGMQNFARRQIGQLSRGQRQRVLLARALAQEGDVIILDEPLAGVDTTTQELVLSLLRELRDRGALVLMSTHDLGVAVEVCDQLLCLNRRLIANGPTRKIFVPDVLRATYGSTLALLSEGLVLHDARR
jgi:manganese/zinc/iron transport system ATP- binding protein